MNGTAAHITSYSVVGGDRNDEERDYNRSHLATIKCE